LLRVACELVATVLVTVVLSPLGKTTWQRFWSPVS
jgi:hypothetical protein